MANAKRFTTEPNVNEKQIFIAENRYLKVNAKGDICENVADMFIRVAKYLASVENMYKTPKKEIHRLEDEFYEMQANFEFIAGIPLNDRDRKKMMADCYVLPLEDSLSSIYKTLYQSVQLHRLGAGVGYDFTVLRPDGSRIHSTGKEASGPISFMRLFDFSSEIILNRGSTRHAGHMGILRIDHPDIEEFIRAKEDYTQLTNFNISVAITDSFMRAYYDNKSIKLKHPRDGVTTKTISARTLLKDIASSAHKSAEPGVIFIDEINKQNTLKQVGRITATNLCGEQPLLPYESCNLGSLNLSKFIKKSNSKSLDNRINWKKLDRVTRLAVRFLDNTIDLSYYVLEESRNIVTKKNRKIGLGLMGWADLLVKLDIAYNSESARKLATKIIRFVRKVGRDESSNLGKIKGSFQNFKKSVFPSLGYKNMRNATITTLAPNGTISLFADCNGGIEPFFALAYIRQNMETLGDKVMVYMNKLLEERLKDEWLYSKELMNKIAKTGSIQDMNEIPKAIRQSFKTALDIEPLDHLKMQATFQKYTDNAVSKTINMPEESTIKDIENIYINAYELKLKGVTIYRDKSRDKQVLDIKKN